MILDMNNDFGFNDIQIESNLGSKERLIELDKKITLLLDNLAAGDGDTIKWPGRKEKISNFKKYYRDIIDELISQ